MSAPGIRSGAARLRRPPAFQVLAKPMGPRCNLNCTYCYYLEKARLFPGGGRMRMQDDLLDIYIREYIAAQAAAGARDVRFNWQGGEPTLLGRDAFRRVLDLQAFHAVPGLRIHNSLQTNGTLVDDAWAAFLAEHDFLVGLSIDGPRALHDCYRRDRAGRPTFDHVVAAAQRLFERGARVNALTVVHRRNALESQAVYGFLKELGFRFIQFIPLVERLVDAHTLAGPPEAGDGAAMAPWSVEPLAFGTFLCGVFDEWRSGDVGEVYVQLFEEQLRLWAGLRPRLCVFAPTCGQSPVLEHNGEVFTCDHYVYPAYRLGNIREVPLAELANSAAQRRFGAAKSTTLPRACRVCAYRFACHGGCPKHRFLATAEGEAGLNYLCAGYRRFFEHAGPKLQDLAAASSGEGRRPTSSRLRKKGLSEPSFSWIDAWSAPRRSLDHSESPGFS